MDALAPVKTRLEMLLFERGLSETAAAAKSGIPTRRLNDKIHHRTEFTLPEMRAIKDSLFPEMTLEEIFEGYGQ